MNILDNRSFEFGLPILEMANLGPKSTGLRWVINIISGFTDDGKKIPHGPRVKVSLTIGKFDQGHNVSVSIDDDPKILAPKGFQFGSQFSKRDFGEVSQFIKDNKDLLIRYWNDPSIPIDEVLSSIVKAKKK